MIKRIGVFFAAVVLAVSIAACSGSSHSAHLNPAKIACAISYHKWEKNGGLKNLESLRNSIPPMVKAAGTHQKGEIRKAAATVESDVALVQSDMPPNCIPGFDIQLKAALIYTDDAVRATTGNSLTGAQMYTKKANLHYTAALQDVEAYIKS